MLHNQVLSIEFGTSPFKGCLVLLMYVSVRSFAESIGEIKHGMVKRVKEAGLVLSGLKRRKVRLLPRMWLLYSS